MRGLGKNDVFLAFKSLRESNCFVLGGERGHVQLGVVE